MISLQSYKFSELALAWLQSEDDIARAVALVALG